MASTGVLTRPECVLGSLDKGGVHTYVHNYILYSYISIRALRPGALAPRLTALSCCVAPLLRSFWPVALVVDRVRSVCAFPLNRTRFDSLGGAARSLSGAIFDCVSSGSAASPLSARSRNANGATCVSTCKNAYETPVGRPARDAEITNNRAQSDA